VPLGALIARTLEGQLRVNAKRADVFNAALPEHTTVLEAIARRDGAAAAAAMAGLLRMTRERIEG
jgi:DNA-binding GntR family transcriptional regulator